MAILGGVLGIVSAATGLLGVGAQVQAGRVKAREAELTAQVQETAATQREADRKQQLAQAMATANAQAGSAGIAALEGIPLTILQQSIDNEQTATERDLFNTRISSLTTRARGQSARTQSQVGAASSLLQTDSRAVQLKPEA